MRLIRNHEAPPLKSKHDLQALAIRLTEPLKSHFTPGCAGMQLGHTAAHYSPVGMRIESLLRPLFGLIPLTIGGGKTDLWPRYREGVINGTDPGHAEYWGPVPSGDQIMVEMTLLGLALAIVPDQLWEPLNRGQRDNLVNWLNQINQCDLTTNNWLFFQVFVNLGLRKFGVRYSREIMETALDKIEYSTLSDSWYFDGPTLQREFENPLYFTRCFTRLYGQSPDAGASLLAAPEVPAAKPIAARIWICCLPAGVA